MNHQSSFFVFIVQIHPSGLDIGKCCINHFWDLFIHHSFDTPSISLFFSESYRCAAVEIIRGAKSRTHRYNRGLGRSWKQREVHIAGVRRLEKYLSFVPITALLTALHCEQRLSSSKSTRFSISKCFVEDQQFCTQPNRVTCWSRSTSFKRHPTSYTI